jgi:hypothetical protein
MKSSVIKKAAQLELAAGVILALSALGAIILFLVGFVPVCPPDDPFDCWDYQKGPHNLPLFAGIALAELLLLWLLTSFAQAFAAGLRLRVAEASLPEEDDLRPQSRKREPAKSQIPPVPPEQTVLPPVKLTPRQSRIWQAYGEPDLSGWTEGTFEDWVRKQV